ncbi:MAG: class I SAM-dependent methyltransferase [Panacagrimonas sp.]
MNYIALLEHLHDIKRPASYLEIGIRKGRSLQLAKCPAIGVDPGYDIQSVLPDRFRLFKETSDDYFAGAALAESRPADGFDFTFIDGMHLFEFVLRDFINTEKQCAPGALIAIDDVFPLDEFMAIRNKRQIPPERRAISNAWTGDVWKIIPTLRKYRPDLHLIPIDCAPTGVLVVTNPDPRNTTLAARYEEIIADPANGHSVSPPKSVLERSGAAAPLDALERIRSILTGTMPV